MMSYIIDGVKTVHVAYRIESELFFVNWTSLMIILMIIIIIMINRCYSSQLHSYISADYIIIVHHQQKSPVPSVRLMPQTQ